MNALDDTRTHWPWPPGTAEGPRLAAAIADRFAAGESIYALAYDYGLPMADIVCAIRSEFRARGRVFAAVCEEAKNVKFSVREPGIDAAVMLYGDARALCADPALPVGDE